MSSRLALLACLFSCSCAHQTTTDRPVERPAPPVANQPDTRPAVVQALDAAGRVVDGVRQLVEAERAHNKRIAREEGVHLVQWTTCPNVRSGYGLYCVPRGPCYFRDGQGLRYTSDNDGHP